MSPLTARLAPSICSGGDFVADRRRRYESYAGLGGLGVACILHDSLPDGGLLERRSLRRLRAGIGRAALCFGADEIVSFDDVGLDGHADHIAVTRAAGAIAVEMGIDHLARTFDPAGLAVEGDVSVKLAAIGRHRSQYDLETGMDGTYDRLAPYLALGLERETYVRMARPST